MAQRTTWPQMANLFDNTTKQSQRKMYLMATDHIDKLRGGGASDATIQGYYDYLLPFYNAFVQVYNSRIAIVNDYQMHTQLFSDLIKELSANKIRRWDMQIQLVHDKPTAQYKRYLGQGRLPFQNGAYEDRIATVAALAENLAGSPDLADVHTDVTAFLTQLTETRNVQQAREADLANIRDEVETKRYDLAEAMFLVFNQLRVYYHTDRYKVENFYERKYLRSTTGSGIEEGDGQTVLFSESGTIAAGQRIAHFSGNLTGDSELLIENTGSVPLQIWVADTNDAERSANFIELPAEDSISFTAEATLHSPETPVDILIINNPTGTEGSYKANILGGIA